MKAVRFHEHGGLDKLIYEDVPDPTPAVGEILVKVGACALNHADIRRRTGEGPLPHILGLDTAGEVVALGDGATSLKVGDRVMIYPGVSCGNCEYCDAGQHNWCADFEMIGRRINGGYAEYVVAPANNARPIPKGMSYIEAATFPICITTAWRNLHTKGRVRPGDLVLIPGAGSGVSVYAIQIAKASGAVVFTTTSTEEKMSKARDLGADHVINYKTDDVVKVVRELTDGRGMDLVIDHVGEATWEQSLGSLRKGGRMVSLGATTGTHYPLDIRAFYPSEVAIMASGSHTRSDFNNGMRLVDQGRVKPVVDSVFPLKEAPQATRRLERGEQFGKIVLSVSESSEVTPATKSRPGT
ncbi:MAG: zinc-binding dehydrogenase [Chloroflexi bacterium]|nr:zinc-binding dehydrogenase [Chloroflexota bacterium]